ncbi:MAG: nucleotide exchange factor GrpE [Candidatus Pacebacteria bacterium]|nr:nucleotide exchange factor GrpE [Candidatus Paceibacterota bacterium]
MSDEEIKNEELNTTDEPADDVVFEDMDEVGDELTLRAKLKKLRDELKQTQKERMEYLTGWQRSQADYVNLKKEADEKLARGKEIGKENILFSILPVLDSFDMAMGNKDAWEKVDANWRKGIEYIYSGFITALTENNISAIDQLAVPFDPNLHQAVETIPTDDAAQDHIIESIIQKGYKLDQKVLRPARVKVYSLNK